jgi:hypothetical protein
MARIRSVKPSISDNEDLAELPFSDRYAFILLWGHCDRRGRTEDRPKRLKARILPWDDIDFDALLQRLHDAGFITRYEVNGGRFIQVNKFESNQRITGDEAKTESKYPPPKQLSNGEETSQEQVSNTGKGKGKGEGKGTGADFPESLDTEECRRVVDDWVEHRRQKHNPATAEAVKKLLKKWADTGPAAFIEAVEHSISNGWDGVFAPKNSATSSRASPQQNPSRRKPQEGKYDLGNLNYVDASTPEPGTPAA